MNCCWGGSDDITAFIDLFYNYLIVSFIDLFYNYLIVSFRSDLCSSFFQNFDSYSVPYLHKNTFFYILYITGSSCGCSILIYAPKVVSFNLVQYSDLSWVHGDVKHKHDFPEKSHVCPLSKFEDHFLFLLQIIEKYKYSPWWNFKGTLWNFFDAFGSEWTSNSLLCFS